MSFICRTSGVLNTMQDQAGYETKNLRMCYYTMVRYFLMN